MAILTSDNSRNQVFKIFCQPAGKMGPVWTNVHVWWQMGLDIFENIPVILQRGVIS